MDVEDLVKSYFRLGFSNKEILCLLAHQHGVIISKRTLQRLCRKLNLFRRKNQTDIEEIACFGDQQRYKLYINDINAVLLNVLFIKET